MMGILSSAMALGRTAVFVVGLAVVLALTIGAATSAVAANGKPNVASKVSNLVKKGVGPALGLKVGADQPPISVNPEAGTATNLSADELDGEDSEEILPLVRAQKDPTLFNSDTVAGMSAQTNSVSIDVPTDGVLMIFGNLWLYNPSNADQ